MNGSGLNAADEHSTEGTQMWLSNGVKPAWIRYEFAQAYKLDTMRVWNANQIIEPMLGFGAKSVTVEYSLDGQTWKTLDGVPEFAQATGLPTYTANTTVDFHGVQAKFVKLTINANWGGVVPQTGLSEVRFFYVPVQAFAPQPADKATGVSVNTTLQWRPGREAESHQVYLGTDRNAMVLVATTAEHSYAPVSLGVATTYYWRIDEVGGGGPYTGEVWSFTTEPYVLVDDFESYNDLENKGTRIYETWTDGWTNGSGSTVGYLDPPFAEQTIVHGGRQSMPLKYDNAAAPNYSETGRTFDPPQDWTQHGITTLVVYFRGQLTNTPAPVYLKINGTKVPFGNNAATALPVWKQWEIPLAATGASLKSVKSLSIGVEGSGTGTLFVDDIRLYAVAPQAVSPADPGTTGLVALYTMDGNTQDTSGKGYHGTVRGDAGYEAGYAGQAMVFNGTNAYVELPIGTLISSLTDTTVATHVNFRGGNSSWQRIFDFGSGSGASPYMFLCPRQGTSGNMRFAIRSATVNEQIVNSPRVLPLGWHHVAVAIDSQAKTITLYVDGERIASGATTVLPRDLGKTTQNWLGKSQYPADGYFVGSLDDFRIYNRALSVAEVRHLAGDR
ncbi:MAG: discoidin domain-containing protein [Planctomycetes bacterium]|nr:discoidin domain-containing protein [Planctomycetota bacterium]